MFDDLGAGPADLEGIVNQLRITKGVLVAVLIHEVDQGEFKISMRANGSAADVSKVALSYGGGGHVKAAGCTLYGEIDEVVVRLVNSIKEELACGGQI